MATIDPSKARFISLYPVDKIVNKGTATFNVAAASSISSPDIDYVVVPHGITNNPGDLVVSGMYSFDQVSLYPAGSPLFGSTSGSFIETFVCDFAIDDTNLYVKYYNSFTSAITLYVLLYFESVA